MTTRFKQRFLGLPAAALCTAISITTITPAKASDFYAWVIADNFCEYLSYGMSFNDAFYKALYEVLDNSIYARAYNADIAQKLPNGYTVAHMRIYNQIEEKCMPQAERAKAAQK